MSREQVPSLRLIVHEHADLSFDVPEAITPDALTVRQFFRRFPDEASCLELVMEMRYGMRHLCHACGAEATFHRIAGRRAFACARCGCHIYPCVGTIFQGSRTPLQLWFYAIYLSLASRRGASSRELQRRLGVTYKAAWRMRQQIGRLEPKGHRAGATGGSGRGGRGPAAHPRRGSLRPGR